MSIVDAPQDKPPQRRYRTQPQPLCPVHGVPMLTYATVSEARYLRCPVPDCPERSKQFRRELPRA